MNGIIWDIQTPDKHDPETRQVLRKVMENKNQKSWSSTET